MRPVLDPVGADAKVGTAAAGADASAPGTLIKHTPNEETRRGEGKARAAAVGGGIVTP